MSKQYLVILTAEERQALHDLIAKGKGAARRLAHARILLKADHGPDGPACNDQAIAAAVEVGTATVERVRRRFVEHGRESALAPYFVEHPRPPARKLDGEQEARLVALACSTPPQGQARWSLRLLADRLVELEVVDTISYETVRQTLKQTS
jgi:transposase